MTTEAIAAALVTVQTLEQHARRHADAVSDGADGPEYQAVIGVMRQAGSLRRSLEQWVVTRATTAPRAAQAAAQGAQHG